MKDKTYYTVYKITNKINGKYYIGCHKTNDLDDNYMGSGKLIKRAIEKYGLDNFTKEYLHIFDNSEDMFKLEEELVIAEDSRSYNMKPGGYGGWKYVHENKLNYSQNMTKEQCDARSIKMRDTVIRKRLECSKYNENYIEQRRCNGRTSFKGKKHTGETKAKIGAANSEHQKGKKNSRFGTMWITNGTDSKTIKKNDIIPNGWYKGRKIKKAQ